MYVGVFIILQGAACVPVLACLPIPAHTSCMNQEYDTAEREPV